MISIAMATYNGEKYLEEQINSILNQTYKNIELIICDDLSTDNTISILSKYQKKDSRVKIFINEFHIGFSQNFTKAISHCKGEYIALADQDDIWIPQKLEHCINNIKDYDIICTNSLLVDQNNNSLNMTMKDIVGYNYIPNNQEDIFKFLCHKNFVQGATLLAKSTFLKNIQVPENFYHDYCYALYATRGNGIAFFDECTIRYRQHDKQITNNKKKKNDLLTVCNSRDLHIVINKKIEILNIISSLNLSDNQIYYIEETKKYFNSMFDKNFFTLKYFITNYDFIYFDKNNIFKVLRIIKKSLGLLFHLIYKNFKKDTIK